MYSSGHLFLKIVQDSAFPKLNRTPFWPRTVSSVHACFASWITCDRGWVQFALLCALHSISTCTLDSLDHHAWKCVIGGPRIEAHPPLSHKYDKECGWFIHCLKCIAMPSSVLCCCQTSFCRKIWPAGHLKCLPAIHCWPMDYFVADDHSPRPVTIPHGRWCSTALREATLGLVQSSEKQNSQSRGSLCMAVTSERNRARIPLDPLPEAVYCLN